MSELQRLRELLKITSTSPESKFFPPTANVEYYKPDGGEQLYVRSTRPCMSYTNKKIRLHFRDHSRSALAQLGSWVGLYTQGWTKTELIEALEAKLITYPEFKAEIQALINTEEEVEQERSRQIREMLDLNVRAREKEIEEFRSSLQVEKILEKYNRYLDISGSNQSLCLGTFGLNMGELDEANIMEELKTSPEIYQLLLNLEERFKEVEEKLEIFQKKIKKIQSFARGVSDIECRCGYTSSGSYVGGRCRCDD